MSFRAMRRFVWILLTLVLPAAAHSAPPDASALPSLADLQAAEYQVKAYPDWQGQILRSASLAERKRSEGGVLGLISLTPETDCTVSVLYYAATGRGLELLDALPLPYAQLTTLSFPLPPGDAGLTRLIVWREAPSSKLLRQLEAAAWQPELQVAGLVDERWFTRSKPAAGLPYYDERQLSPPQGFFRARGPSVQASISAAGIVTARNCGVFFRGPIRFASDSWGSYGQWQLGGPPLELIMVLPPRRDYSRALLRLHGELDSAFASSEPLQLGLEVNGWRREEIALAGGNGLREQVSFDVSQNIEYGLNTFSLRSSGFGADWLLSSIELWIE